MKKIKIKLNPILEPYLPRFKEILWIKVGFEEAMTDDFKHYHSVTYPQTLYYFQSLTRFILDYPSRKQVDALMEMLLFVMVFNFFVQVDHYDNLLENVINDRFRSDDVDEVVAIRRRYDKFKTKYSKWCNTYVEKCGILASQLPSETIDSSVYSTNGFAYEIKHTFKHYLDTAVTLNAPEIIDFNWSNLAIHDLHTKLVKREQEVRAALKKAKKLLPQGQVWIEFDDGFRWTYLPRPTCQGLAAEGDHCATVESWMGSKYGRLLYLTDSEGNLVLTASYAHLKTYQAKREEIAELYEGRDYGVLGQIRGNHNTKPKKEYVKYIATLLCDERVIFHIADSYKDEAQFWLHDLDAIQKGRIEQCNPSIFDLSAVADHVPLAQVLILLNLLAQQKIELAEPYDIDQPQPKANIVFWSGATDNFLQELGQDQSFELWKSIQLNDDLIYAEISDDDIQNFVEDLDKDHLKKLYDKLVELKFVPESQNWKDVYQSVKECDEVESAISRSVYTGYRLGTEVEAFKQLKSRVEDILEILSKGQEMEVRLKSESLYGDDAIQLFSPIKTLLRQFKSGESIDHLEANYDSTLGQLAETYDGEIHESRNQYDSYFEYDRGAALEDFFGYQIHDL